MRSDLVGFDSPRFVLIQIRFDWLRFDLIRFGSAPLDSVLFDLIGLFSERFDSIRFASIRSVLAATVVCWHACWLTRLLVDTVAY
jgi:hypothetical protein